MSQTLQYLTDEHGDRTAVVLPISEYEKLLEDLEDLAVVAERREIPAIPIYVDSPLAVNATEVYRKHPECYDAETHRLLRDGVEVARAVRPTSADEIERTLFSSQSLKILMSGQVEKKCFACWIKVCVTLKLRG
ncbi:MAG: hypothetical protein HC783_10625 [Rhodobacteraceae bacterium]|nr:hypothetical protein [Paracoccaceae bacterium]